MKWKSGKKEKAPQTRMMLAREGEKRGGRIAQLTEEHSRRTDMGVGRKARRLRDHGSQ